MDIYFIYIIRFVIFYRKYYQSSNVGHNQRRFMETVNVWSAQIASLPGVTPIPLGPSYLRGEASNRLSVLSSDGKQTYTILNRVAKEILDLCDGTRDLPEVLRLFQDKYPDQPRETLAHDLAQTLHNLTVNCLIVWKKNGRCMNDPFGSDYLTSVDPDELLILADASRFAEIEEAAAKSLSAKQFKNGNRIYFSEFDVEPELENFLVLRQRLFSFTHDYFLLASQSGDINGLIICEPTPNPAGRSVTIKFISCNSTLLAGVLDRLAEYYGSSAPKAYLALRINAPDSDPIAERLDRSDQHLGFSLVGTLPNEIDSGDVKLFVRPLDKEQ